MRKVIFVSLLILGTLASSESHRVYLGLIQLAGLVPESLPAPGTPLHFENTKQALRDQDTRSLGYIPTRFRTAIDHMQKRGLPLSFEVEHVYATPLPGKYLSVEVWVETDDVGNIFPLIYSIPIHGDSTLAGNME